MSNELFNEDIAVTENAPVEPAEAVEPAVVEEPVVEAPVVVETPVVAEPVAPKPAKAPKKVAEPASDEPVAIFSTKNVTWSGVGKVYRGYNIVSKEKADQWLERDHIRLATPEEVAKEYNK